MIKCYRDEQGFRRVDPNGLHPLIASYLEQDVQGSRSACQELVGIIAEVADGCRTEWSGTGNAHTVTIRPGVVVIHNEWDDSLGDARLPLGLFLDCVEAWNAYIAS